MPKKLIVGISPHFQSLGSKSRFFLYSNYCELIEFLGHVPMIFPYLTDTSVMEKAVEGVDVILISGGGPSRTINWKKKRLRDQNMPRYDFERALIRLCIKKKIPMIGVCRGFQTIAEVLGGKIKLNIKNHLHRNSAEPAHDILIEKDSMLYKALKIRKIGVNSTHRQAVDSVPDMLKVVARSDDGIIEAYESDDPLILCTQFHPEKMYKGFPIYSRILDVFLKRCILQNIPQNIPPKSAMDQEY